MKVEIDEQSDDLLLQQYLTSRNEEAFGVLVRRYGPMVWGICRRILRHTQDAEDALQATFAVLSRKARTIRRNRTIGAWLHQVAFRIALRERAASNRRIPLTPDTDNIVPAEKASAKNTVDVNEILDDEIARLPTALRLPIIMCYLEGLTNGEAARRLDCPEGTLVSRLARGRDKLRSSLTRRGVVLGSVAALTVLLAEIGVAAPMSAELTKAALACCRLTETGPIVGGSILSAGATRLAMEALREMKLRFLVGSAALTLCGAFAITVVVLFALGPSNPMPLNGRVQNEVLTHEGQPTNSIQGIWQVEELEFIGGNTPRERAALSRDGRWVIAGNAIQFKWQDQKILSADFELDSSLKPKGIDFQPTDLATMLASETLRGVFKFDQASLEVCTARPDGERPPIVRAGVVARPAVGGPEILAGLVGYCRLRRIVRSYEAEELQGRWGLLHWERGGEDLEIDAQGRQGARFENDTYTLYHVFENQVLEIRGTFSLDPAQPARFMEMLPTGGEPFRCLYEIEEDTLQLVAASPGAPRPEGFRTLPDQRHMAWVFRRPKPAAIKVP